MPTQTLEPDVLDVLRNVEIDGQHVRITQTLDRPLYLKVNEALTRLGGVWKSGKIKAHVFSGGKDPAQLIAAMTESEVMPAKNPFAFFPTPPAVVALMLKRMTEWHDDFPFCRILEPSAGDGAIAEAVTNLVVRLGEFLPGDDKLRHFLKLVEVDHDRAEQLRQLLYDPAEADFLSLDLPEVLYSCILMNPPFAVEGSPKAYMHHFRRAWEWLKPGGVLVGIAPPGFTFSTDNASLVFLEFVQQYGGWEELDEGAFKVSGTGVRTVLIRLRKPR